MTFIPTVMINERTTVEEIFRCVNSGVCDAKIYPLDRTTKSHNGVRDYSRLVPLIQYCGRTGMRVHFHPEHPWMLFGNREAEFAFLAIVDMFLRETNTTIIWEHGTDARCIPFWKEMAAQTGRFFVTLTAHHLATDEDETFGDVRSVCKPSIKTKFDQQSLLALVAEDCEWVMAGADDAPHDRVNKHVHEGRCACGAYTAPFALQLYAHALDLILSTGKKGHETFANFTSRNARKLYNLEPASRQFELSLEPFKIPEHYQVGSWIVEPFWANQDLKYSLNKVVE